MKGKEVAMMVMDQAIKGRRAKKKSKKKDFAKKDKAIKKQEEMNYREVQAG